MTPWGWRRGTALPHACLLSCVTSAPGPSVQISALEASAFSQSELEPGSCCSTWIVFLKPLTLKRTIKYFLGQKMRGKGRSDLSSLTLCPCGLCSRRDVGLSPTPHTILSPQQMDDMQEPGGEEEVNAGTHSPQLDVASLQTILSLSQTRCPPCHEATWQS